MNPSFSILNIEETTGWLENKCLPQNNAEKIGENLNIKLNLQEG